MKTSLTDNINNSQSIPQKRDISLDIMKGYGMLGVFIAHTETIPSFPYRKIFLTYCIPIFFFLGGYFYHQTVNYKKKLSKDFVRLIVPYLFTASIVIVYTILFSYHFKMPELLKNALIASFWGSGFSHNSYLWGSIQPIGPIWFLLALFWCRIAYNIIMTNTKYPYLVCLLVGITAVLLDYYIINLPFCILPGLSCLVFYMIGDMCKKLEMSIPLFIVIVACFILGVLFSHISVTNCDYGFYPLDIICAFGSTYLIYLLSKGTARVKYIGKYIEWVGVNSLIFLCFHTIDLDCSISRYFHIPRDWYILLPFQLCLYSVAVIVCHYFKITKAIFSIKK